MRILGRLLVFATLGVDVVLVGLVCWLALQMPLGFPDERNGARDDVYSGLFSTAVTIGLAVVVAVVLVVCGVSVWRYHRAKIMGRRLSWILVGVVVAAHIILAGGIGLSGASWVAAVIAVVGAVALSMGLYVTAKSVVASNPAPLIQVAS